ncbi:MAG: GlsB/YeaQ/YmgE family stress response membrane protein [Actinomycetia bacterium]|nr:GlsB/YeaQ/YmgE family stress response membrane protein [Actinomycetes bacterium]
MIILAILGIGMFAGWFANLVLGGGTQPKDWGEVLVAGVVGSFVGGLLGSLIWSDDLAIHPSGIIGSVVGAIIVLAIWRAVRSRS